MPEPPSRRLVWLAGVTIVLTALNLRPAVTSMGALIRDVQLDTGMSASLAGLLTSLPPICFGIFGLVVGRLARRWGTATTVLVALSVTSVALVARVLTDRPVVLVLLTLPALAGMAAGNVLLPATVRRWYPRRVGRATGWYSLGLALGTAGAAGLAVPIAQAGGSWRWGLGAWAAPALLAAVPWLWLRRAERRGTAGGRAVPAATGPTRTTTSSAAPEPDPDAAVPAAEPAPAPAPAAVPPAAIDRTVRRSRQAWALAGFFGLQSLAAYSVMGWLPSIFQDAGLPASTSGWLLALVMGLGAPVSLVLPEFAARHDDQRAWVVGLALTAGSAYVGLLLAPTAAPVLWATLLGIGLGAFPLALVLIGLRALTDAGTTRLSSLAQGTGYLVAAGGPVLLGVLHDLTDAWTVPLLVLLTLLVPQGLCGLVAAAPGHVDAEPAPRTVRAGGGRRPRR